ncbi:MAG: tripartite tricarboxylate transporter substrate binding protein [Burkholderiales bacterium]
MIARVLAAVFCVAITIPASAQSGAWKPARNVEIVVGVGPGGGIDRTARFLQKLLQDQRLIEVTATVVNKPGGGGSIAQTYLNQRAGDSHYFEITATSLLTNHITGKSAFGHKDFTPIAMLSDEYIGFLVRQDSPLKTGKDLLTLLRADSDSIPIGIATAAGNTNHIAAGLAAKAAGGDVKKLKVVVFGSGGEAMTALLGGHVGLVATPSSNAIPHLQAGRMRVLAIAAPARLEGALATVPTWKEQGAQIIVANWRPVIGPRGLSAPQVAFWEEVFARVTRSDEWRSEVARSGGVNHYLNSRNLAAYFDEQYAQFKTVLTELGLAKQP